ncbi:methylenetetrahydrofolate reductase [Candidatus Thorarchaeota archaeon]|jgi:methylenetetrahydrofolate reductase (NADPH)|nr:MAG: methylenetetrahydrofolate reductase [Candidatus Thorarchaeota archaeon]
MEMCTFSSPNPLDSSFSIDIKDNKKGPDAVAFDNSMEKTALSRTRLRTLLEDNEFVVTSEIDLPCGSDASRIIDSADLIKDYCDVINAPDNPMGNPCMSSTIGSHFIIQAGAEPVLQISSRDRNRIAIQSELFAAHALGIRNILFISGDHSRHGYMKRAKSVYDIDSIEALEMSRELMQGYNALGEELEGTPHFFLGATFNPYEEPMEEHVLRTERKSEAGAQFFQTQGIYDPARLEEFLSRVEYLDPKVIAGIIPLQSPEMARFMNEFVPGLVIPEHIIERLEAAADGLEEEESLEATRPVGIQIATETIAELRKLDGVHGVHIMGVGWLESVIEIVKEAGLFPRPL